ncbi:MAG: TVP38/TMEM64 family protein [Alphaproteobacteria bacterium]|nr:MAG: TVP38/TMEM64 family protein [Alphaproteobacteria bacterium]
MASRVLSWRRALPLIAIVLAGAVGVVMLSDYLSFEALRTHREELIAFRDRNAVLAGAIYMIAYVVVVALSLPGAVWVTLAGGFLFGAVPAALMTVVAATVGATILFLAAKTGLGDALHERLVAQAREGGLLKRIEAGLHRNEISVLLLIRLVPAVPFFVANLAPAFLGVKLRNFVLTTFFGIMPGTAAFAWVGSGLGEIFDRGGEPDLGILLSWPVLGPILGLCALALLPLVIRALRGREPL